MHPGDFFGEQALLYNSPRTASVTTMGEVKCLAIGRQRLKKVLGSQLQQVMYRNSIRMAFERNPEFSLFADEMIKQMQVRSYRRGQVVIPAGS